MYGLLMALGGLLGWRLSLYRARHFTTGMSQEQGARWYLQIMVGALVGAKVYSLILVLPDLLADLPLLESHPAAFLAKYVYGGMVFYGGVLGGSAVVLFLLISKRARFSWLETIFVPIIPLVHGIGRIGCFCAGCCYGIPTESALGVVFPPGGIAPAGTALIPIQLWEAGGDFLLAILLWLPWYQKEGERLAVYLLGYGCLRFITEFYRGDIERGLAGTLSMAQWISLGCMIAGVCLLLKTRGWQRKRLWT